MSRLDLHSHSHYSDGTLPPAEVVRRAQAAGVEVLALTDHDSVSGVGEAAEAGVKLGLRVVPGIEINTAEDDLLHVLGYRIDPLSEKLAARLESFRDRRRQRIQAVVERLRNEARLDIGWEDVVAVSRQSLGRPHVADALVRKRIVHSRREAFEKFLAKGRVGYVQPLGPSAQEAIIAIQEAGGWASLAHPGTMNYETELPRLASYGLGGIEVYYPTHSTETIEKLLRLADAHRLIPTIGSDYHGPRTGRDRIGTHGADPELAARLLERLS
ncbi:MAG: PHP domain-containing protein [Elusimicrobia bacterium]|nr:PHP domain-containing protein [Elusimicrobiota bacterium]